MGTCTVSTKTISNRDARRLERALELSYESSCKMRHGALIYKSNRLIATGINSSRIHNAYMSSDQGPMPSFHAEERAIRNALALVGDLSGMSIYIARSYRDGTPALSKPCTRCQSLIREVGIKKVVYTR